jgi:hypothetical protein
LLLLLRVQIIFLAAIEDLLSRFTKRRAPVAGPLVAADGRLSETRHTHAGMFGCDLLNLNIIGIVICA